MITSDLTARKIVSLRYVINGCEIANISWLPLYCNICYIFSRENTVNSKE